MTAAPEFTVSTGVSYVEALADRLLGHDISGFRLCKALRERGHQIRSLVLRVDLVGPVGSGLLTLDGSSIWSDPNGSRRIVWMIKRMIRRLGQLDDPVW